MPLAVKATANCSRMATTMLVSGAVSVGFSRMTVAREPEACCPPRTLSARKVISSSRISRKEQRTRRSAVQRNS